VSSTISIGRRENSFLLTFASSGKHFFRFEEARDFWGSAHNARVALHRMLKKGLLAQIEKGKYLILPLESGEDRRWSEDPYLVADFLVHPAAISYWSAIRHWGWTEQIPRTVYVQTTRRKSRKRRLIFGVEYEFVTVAGRKFFGLTTEWRGGKAIQITDREKTLVDCADDVERAGTIEELVKAVRRGSKEISWEKLDRYAQRFPNRAVLKRLGFLLENDATGLPAEAKNMLAAWQSRLSAGIADLQPSGGEKGRIASRWRIRVNAEAA
jgi:predicted transcriptional regulator of viral defense system